MPPDEPLSSLFYLVGVLFLLVGCGAIFFGRRYSKLADASNRWPSAEGTVLRSYIHQSADFDQQGRSKPTYEAKIEYEFHVEDRRYEGKRMRFGRIAVNRILSMAEQRLKPYPVGAAVEVFYDPADPTHCTLDRTISKFGVLFMYLLGLVFLAFGTGALLVTRFAA